MKTKVEKEVKTMENMTEKKMTQKDFYTAIAAIEGLDAELVAYAEAQIVKIDERNEKAKAKRAEKVKEVKEEDVALMAAITEVLDGAEAMTAKAIWEALGNEDVKVQKVSAILRKMDNVVAEDGKVKTYHLA
jgi:hypothetical protein